MTSISIQKIEDELELKFPSQLREFYEREILPKKIEVPIKVQCKHLINDWKYGYNFWVLINDFNKGDYWDIYKEENWNINGIINASKAISGEIKRKVLCFAWSYDCIEKDTGIFYMEDGKIYGYSLNMSNDYKFDFITDDFNSVLNPNSANRIPKIEEIVSRHNWYYGDGESADSVDNYKEIIEDYFIKTSDNRLNFEKFKGEEIGTEKRKIEIELNGNNFEFELDTHNGWIDPQIIGMMNEALKKVGINDKKYVEIRDQSWGQELGVAFVNKEELEKLIEFKYSKN